MIGIGKPISQSKMPRMLFSLVVGRRFAAVTGQFRSRSAGGAQRSGAEPGGVTVG